MGWWPRPKVTLGAYSGPGNIFVSTWKIVMKSSLGRKIGKEEVKEVVLTDRLPMYPAHVLGLAGNGL